MSVAILIPAYNPDEKLLKLLTGLQPKPTQPIIVVNDGSLEINRHIFDAAKDMASVVLLEHDKNQGKGAALKTGLLYIQKNCPDISGVVTADCDGQHDIRDILRIADTIEKSPDSPVIGVRTFGKDCPILIRIWSRLTRAMLRFSYGPDLTDVLCGLRGIPTESIPRLLAIPYNRYEFETEMILAWSNQGLAIQELPIATIGLSINRPIHFNPLVDSMRICFVLTRYVFVSVVTALTDYLVFLSVFPMLQSVLASTYFARLLALCINYILLRKFVFCSREVILRTFWKYFLLVIMSGFVSSALIEYLVSSFGLSILLGKMISELILYVAIFAIQRDFVFVDNAPERETDWDAYYEAPYRTASYSRAITTRHLIDNMKRFGLKDTPIEAAELGGANSCFYDAVRAELKPKTYCMCDTNALGLEKIKKRAGGNPDLVVQECDVLNMSLDRKFDVVFSVGLVEHFYPEDTSKAIRAHFDILKPGGIAIISFPSPTFLYRATRGLAEFFRMWIFHDERPLEDAEVNGTIEECGTVLDSTLIWPIMLTQRMVVVKKAASIESQ
jgi:glycosyltransferase involved in cell wall biosynthesis/SAM-dependent methyltransferase